MGFSAVAVLIAVTLAAIFIGQKINNLFEDLPIPNLPQDFWWGPGERRPTDSSIRPFQISISPEIITDLHARLDRFLAKPVTPPLENKAFQYGFNTNYLKTVIKYWRQEYDWEKRQEFLNKFPQFKTNINGLEIHFIRVTPNAKATGKRVLPLLLLHGWPGSVREFYEIIPLLTTPRDGVDFVFDVVAPSLPGYGFSDGAAKPGLGPPQIAVLMNNLMKRIGLNKYYVQGGDWGANIGKRISSFYPDNVLGFHSNMCFINTPASNLYIFIGSFFPRFLVEEKEEHLLYPYYQKILFLLEEMGYAHIQGTKPDTIGVALGDTPSGLAAYILEKFSTWTNPKYKQLLDGGLTKKYSLAALLDNVMLYWVTNSITTSQRIYAEEMNITQYAMQLDQVPITVPTGCARFHSELAWLPEKILRLHYRNLQHIADYEEGGHFAAFEQPKVLAADLDKAVTKFEQFYMNSSKQQK